jgi:hypothetical protein
MFLILSSMIFLFLQCIFSYIDTKCYNVLCLLLWHHIHQIVTCKRTYVLDIYLLVSKCIGLLPLAMS